MIKLRKTAPNGTAFILVADEQQRRLVVYEEVTCSVYHSQTLLNPPCGRLGVQAQRNGALYFELNASECDEISAGFNRQTRRTENRDTIDADFVRANYAHLPVTRDCGQARTRRTNTTTAPASVSTPASRPASVSTGNHQTRIQGYHSSQYGAFVRCETIENGDALGMGLELEVVHPEGRNPRTDDAILNAVKNSGFTMADCIVETDSTVTFEIVFNAFTLDKWREHEPKLRNLCRLLSAAGFQSEQGGRCGLHTHISRNYLKMNGDGKLFGIHMKYADFFKKLSRRTQNGYGYCNFTTSDLNRLDSAKNNHDRYTAINNNNRATVELRYWRGTLNAERIMQQLDFIQQLVDNINTRDSYELLIQDHDTRTIASWFTGAARDYIHLRAGV